MTTAKTTANNSTSDYINKRNYCSNNSNNMINSIILKF